MLKIQTCKISVIPKCSRVLNITTKSSHINLSLSSGKTGQDMTQYRNISHAQKLTDSQLKA